MTFITLCVTVQFLLVRPQAGSWGVQGSSVRASFLSEHLRLLTAPLIRSGAEQHEPGVRQWSCDVAFVAHPMLQNDPAMHQGRRIPFLKTSTLLSLLRCHESDGLSDMRGNCTLFFLCISRSVTLEGQMFRNESGSGRRARKGWWCRDRAVPCSYQISGGVRST